MKAPEQKQRELIPAGTHRAVCYTVCDLGTQDVQYPGKPPSSQRQLLITWELPEVRLKYEDDGKEYDKPKVISTTYTFSLFKGANLFKHLMSWIGSIGDDFDFESLIGLNCMLSIVHQESKSNGKTYDRVAGVMQMPTGMPISAPENPVIFYSIQDHGLEYPVELTGNERMSWLLDKIKASPEIAFLGKPLPSKEEMAKATGQDVDVAMNNHAKSLSHSEPVDDTDDIPF